MVQDGSAAEAALSNLRDRLDRAREEGALVTIVGECEVEYEGRASSYLGPGDRLVVLKPDGTVLVHTDEGRTPVNWQPPGSTQQLSIADGTLRVESTRTNPAEELLVRFFEIESADHFAMADDRDLELSGTEADLRDRILQGPELIEDGLTMIEAESPTGAGAVDLLGRDHEGVLVAVEVKRRRVGPDAVGQLSRYVESLKREQGDQVRGVLVAPSVTETANELLGRQGLEFVSLSP